MQLHLLSAAHSKSADILTDLLRSHDIGIVGFNEADGVVSWGVAVPNPRLPTLNARAGMGSKLAQLETLRNADIPVPKFGQTQEGLSYPIFGRRLRHTGGTDILPILLPMDEAALRESGIEYFTEFVPHRREFRVWVYRGRRLGVYEKVLRYPNKLRGVAHNWANGYAFVFCPEPPPTLVPVAGAAVDALGLDFGAVDVLETAPAEYVVLEVNTRPGVEDARAGLVNLAEKIARWGRNGFPRRRHA